MAKNFVLKVITPERVFYEGEVEMVIVKTVDGDQGYLADHSWQVKLLDVGELKIKEPGGKKKIAAIADGYIDVSDYILIYTDAAEWPEEIDIERASRKREVLEEMLREAGMKSNLEISTTRHDILKSLNRLNVSKYK